jgi:hypothetical protein
MPLTPQQKLEEAESALHSLQTGTMARVIVDRNGERVEFTSANRQGLITYISDLRLQVGEVVPDPVASNGPLSFFF